MFEGEGHRLSRYAEQGAALSIGDSRGGADTPEAIKLLDWRHLSAIQPQPKTWAIPNFAPAAEVTLFTGAGSAGKSLLAQQLCTAMAAGVSTLGLTIEQAPAIYVTCEDDEGQLHFRQDHICRSLGVPMASLNGKFLTASLRGELDNALAVEGHEGFEPTLTYHRIVRLVQETEAKLLALDNVAHLFTGNENDRGEVTRFINLLSRLAGETGAAILLLGHPPKTGADYSGSTAWLNAVRSQFVIEHDEVTDMRTIKLGKANYGRKGAELRFAWVDWAFVLEGDLPPDTAARLAETARAQAENAAFLACLRAREAQGEGRLVGPNSGSNYAPAQFEGMPEAKGLQRDRLKAAMNRLFATGAIETFSYRNKAKARDVTIIREVPRTPSRTVPGQFPNGTPTTARPPP